jgi:hypothetical protein
MEQINAYRNLVTNLKGTDDLEGLNIDGRIILDQLSCLSFSEGGLCSMELVMILTNFLLQSITGSPCCYE